MGEANALTDLGSALYFLDNYADATRCQEATLGIYRDLGEQLGRGNALAELGAVRTVTGDYPGATEALEAARGILVDCGNQAGQANVLNFLGVVRRLTGNVTGSAASSASLAEKPTPSRRSAPCAPSWGSWKRRSA
jgi:hypothetical protein